ncbi:MAG: transcription termination factor Rho [Planctomycetes bacterium]|nr:transcription termination factor Rho [Planctomycetota bacterium]
MSQFQKSFKRRRNKHRLQHAGGGGGGAPFFVKNPERPWIDFSKLPADLSPEALAELESTLPKPRAKAKQKPLDYAALQKMKLEELHEYAEEEGIEGIGGKKREDVVFEIASFKLKEGTPVHTEGCLEITKENHGFLRNPGNAYLPSSDDVFVPGSMINQYGLQTGMTLKGSLRPTLENERYFALAHLELVDKHDPDDAAVRSPFKELVPLYPEQRILLEGGPENPLEMRIVDLITPIGRGQRGLIVAPPRTGKTILLQMLARSIVTNAPDAHLIILLIDERPEEVTDFTRMLPEGKAEIVSSTFDEPAWHHIQVAEMVMRKARCLVEAGEDVIILLDSITRLARACNIEAPSNGKLLSGGIEASALQMPKKFFGSARKIEGGGSLTILGTALIETGSKMDEVIFEEFKGTGNMELVLERRLADRRIFPAIDINRSGTRKEELLFTPEEIRRVWMLRKVLNEMDPVEAMEMLIQKIKKTRVNGEFLLSIGS